MQEVSQLSACVWEAPRTEHWGVSVSAVHEGWQLVREAWRRGITSSWFMDCSAKDGFFYSVLGTLAESVLLQVGQRLEIDFTL